TRMPPQSEHPTELDLSPPAEAAGLPLVVEAYGKTDRGQVRQTNEDQFLVAGLAKALHVEQTSLPQRPIRFAPERGHLFIVADGMGGHQAGERASALAVYNIEHFMLNTFKWFFHLKGPEGQNVLEEFQQALRQTDAHLIREATQQAQLWGMGTTVTM